MYGLMFILHMHLLISAAAYQGTRVSVSVSCGVCGVAGREAEGKGWFVHVPGATEGSDSAKSCWSFKESDRRVYEEAGRG